MHIQLNMYRLFVCFNDLHLFQKSRRKREVQAENDRLL